MRVDLFLKQSRILKRRSLAKELCDEGTVLLNGRPIRAAHDVAVGDEIILNLRNRKLCVQVLEVPERAPSAARACELYRVSRDERVDEAEHV